MFIACPFQVQVELKKSLHKEAKINKQRQRDHKTKKILQSIPRNDDGDSLISLPDETLNRSPGKSCNVFSKINYFMCFKNFIKYTSEVEWGRTEPSLGFC